MKHTLYSLKRRQIINPSFEVNKEDAEWIQRVDKQRFSDDLYMNTEIPNYWAAALQNISVSATAKKRRLPKLRSL